MLSPSQGDATIRLFKKKTLFFCNFSLALARTMFLTEEKQFANQSALCNGPAKETLENPSKKKEKTWKSHGKTSKKGFPSRTRW